MKHPTADVECADGSKASVNIESSLKMVVTVIAVALAILGALTGVFAFAYGTKGIADAAQKDATSAHARVVELRAETRQDIQEIKRDVKSLTRAVLKRLPDAEE